MSIQAVTFDCYGTLIDWERGLIAAATPALERGGWRLSGSDFFRLFLAEQRALIATYRPYREILGTASHLALSAVGISPRPAEIASLAASMGAWPPYTDTVSALAKLKGRVKIGILSNVEDQVLAQSIAQLGTPIDFTVTAEQVKSYKPNPAHFTSCIQRLQVTPAEILHVGWLEYDVIPAKAAGMTTCWINREKKPRPAEKAIDYELTTLEELPSVLDRASAR